MNHLFQTFVLFKGATKLFFTHYSCVVIIFSSTGISKSAFSTYYFGILVFYLSVFCVFCNMRFEFDVLYNHCSYKHHLAICNFVLTSYKLFLFVKTLRSYYENSVSTHIYVPHLVPKLFK